jgi:hypothetical protein
MKPPNHKLGALRIIDDADPAWDHDRVGEELDGLDLEEKRAHPVMAYQLGLTHYDLDAPGTVYDHEGNESSACARDYLRPEVNPRVFEARRLSPLEVATCMDRGEQVGRLWAFGLAVKGIEGANPLTFHVPARKAATDGQVQAVVDALGYQVVSRIGQAVLDASRAPTPQEGKRSGSPAGE